MKKGMLAASSGAIIVGLVLLVAGAAVLGDYYLTSSAGSDSTSTIDSISSAISSLASSSTGVSDSSTTTISTASSSSSASSSLSNPNIIYVGMYGAGQGGNYNPANITVVIGVNNTVDWINNDTSYTPHTVTAMSGPVSFNSGMISAGSSFNYTFTVPGTYTYYCTYHSWMKGEIVVENS